MTKALRKRAKRTQKGRETCPFCVLNGLNEVRLTALERMAGTTRLELATSAVTARCRMSALIVPLLYPDLAGLLIFSYPLLPLCRSHIVTQRRLPLGGVKGHKAIRPLRIALSGIPGQDGVRKNGARALHNAIA
jgi:hypothetical protein